MSLCDSGRRVFGIEVSEERLKYLLSGESPIEDVSNAKLKEHLKSKFYIPTNSYESISKCGAVIICVPTPLNEDLSPDLGYLESAVGNIAKFIQEETLLVNESTSFIGTVREVIKPMIEKNNPEIRVYYATAPERIDPRNEKWSIKNTPRLVAGLDKESSNLVTRLYESICSAVIPVEKIEIAEMAKLLENSFRLINIALVNDLSKVARAYGIDIEEVIEAAATKPYGYMPFHSGLGVGGHCIPVDPVYLTWSAEKMGVKSTIINAANQINRARTLEVGEIITKDNATDKRVMIFGIGYKGGVADTRESPSIELMKNLRESGFKVTWRDNLVKNWNGEIPDSGNNFEILVYVHGALDLDVEKLINEGKVMYDLSGKFRHIKGIIRP
jgi:UDP-N-acetyl-D-glucosamine dehydrogenase